MSDLFGRNSKYFNYSEIYGHVSWNRHTAFVSSEFVRDLFGLYTRDYPNKFIGEDYIVEDTPNFDKWHEFLENGCSLGKGYCRPSTLFYYDDPNVGKVIMFPTSRLMDLYFWKYNLTDKTVPDNIMNELIVTGPLNELRLIECPEQKEYIIYDKKISKELKTDSKTAVYPAMAFNKFNKMLDTVYNESEKQQQYKDHQLKDEETRSIVHYQISSAVKDYEVDNSIEGNNNVHIVKFDNCYEYDINAAYFSALMEVFPKAKKKLTSWYKKRHDNDNYFKKVINYTVGCMTINNKKKEFAGEKRLAMVHHETRNWIVDRISKQLMTTIESLGGNLIYANTDGFIVQNPDKVLPGSKEIGEFDLEAQGTVYGIVTDRTKETTPYFAFQFEDKLNNRSFIKGNLPVELRDKLDLTIGQYPTFKTIVNKYNIPEFTNIKINKEIK